MKPNLLVVLQTHSLGDSQRPDGSRFVKVKKSEVMRRCTKSLIESLNYASIFLNYFSFELIILDDHSDQQSLENLQININAAKFPCKIISLETKGIMPSILACYEYGKTHGSDWVYFAQDDYLYEETAIYDMIMVAIETSHALQNFTCVFPYDDPYRYIPENTAIQSHIIRSQKRHWRTQVMTSSCFLVHHQVIIQNWDLFYNMGTHELTEEMEDKTINQLFRSRGYYLFVPIPSLAFHIQYETEHDPFYDWKKLWDKFNDNFTISNFIRNKKRPLLNIGFGGCCLKDCVFAEDLLEYDEITMDIDTKYNPDIVCDINDMSSIPTGSVDFVYMSHVLEHLDYFSVDIVLKEIARILKTHGEARIIVPNIAHVIPNIQEDKLFDTVYESPGGPVTTMDILYGSKYSIKRKNNSYMIHKLCFTPNVVNHFSQSTGLSLLSEQAGHNLIITLKK